MLKKIARDFLLPALLLLGCVLLIEYPGLLDSWNVKPIYVQYIAKSGIWFFSAALVSRFFNLLWNRFSEKAGKGTVPGIAQYMVSFLFYLAAFAGVWSNVFHQPISGILAASGFIGLIMGFALRSLIMDLFIGLTVNFDQPYKIGDFILINKEKIDGQVIDISWRTTRLKTGENNVLVIPNNMMSSMVITNFSTPSSESEMDMMFTFDFSVPIRDVKRILHSSVVEVINTKGFLRHEEPKVRIKGINAMGIEYKVKYWIDAGLIGPGKSKDKVMESIITNLQKSGIAPAYPKTDSYYATMPSKVVDYRSEKGRLSLLGQIDALEQLETEYLEMIASRMVLRFFETGDVLFKEGEPGESMYIVVVGVLKVSVSRNGAELDIAQITPGQFFGEMSMLTGEPRTATIKAATDVIAYEINREHLSEVFEKQPKTIEIISTVIAQRQLSNNKTMEKLSENDRKNEVESLAKQLWRRIVSFEGSNKK